MCQDPRARADGPGLGGPANGTCETRTPLPARAAETRAGSQRNGSGRREGEHSVIYSCTRSTGVGTLGKFRTAMSVFFFFFSPQFPFVIDD